MSASVAPSATLRPTMGTPATSVVTSPEQRRIHRQVKRLIAKIGEILKFKADVVGDKVRGQLNVISDRLSVLDKELNTSIDKDRLSVIKTEVDKFQVEINSLDPRNKRWACRDGKCVEDPEGKFTSLEDCKKSGCEGSSSEPVPKGIMNTGMNCFFNAVLQMYFRIPGLRQAVLSSTTNSPQAIALKSIFTKLSDSTLSPIDIRDETKSLFTGHESTFFKDGNIKTSDAAEFITVVLEKILNSMSTNPLKFVKVEDITSTACSDKPAEIRKTSIDTSLVPLDIGPVRSIDAMLNIITSAIDTEGTRCSKGTAIRISHKFQPKSETTHLVVYLKRFGSKSGTDAAGVFKPSNVVIDPVIKSGDSVYRLEGSVLFRPSPPGHYIASIYNEKGELKNVFNDASVSPTLPTDLSQSVNGMIFLYKLVRKESRDSDNGSNDGSSGGVSDDGSSGSDDLKGFSGDDDILYNNDSDATPAYVLTVDRFKEFMLESIIPNNSRSTGYAGIGEDVAPWNDKYYFKFPVILVSKTPATEKVDDLRRFNAETGLTEADILAVNGRFVKNSIKDVARNISYGMITKYLLIFIPGIKDIYQVLPIQKDFIEFFHQILFQAALNKKSIPAFTASFVEKYKGALPLLEGLDFKGDVFGLPGYELLKWWNIERAPLYATFEVIALEKLIELVKKPKALLQLFKNEVRFVSKVKFRVEDLEENFDETVDNYEKTIAEIKRRNSALKAMGLRLLGASNPLVPPTYFDDILAGADSGFGNDGDGDGDGGDGDGDGDGGGAGDGDGDGDGDGAGGDGAGGDGDGGAGDGVGDGPKPPPISPKPSAPPIGDDCDERTRQKIMSIIQFYDDQIFGTEYHTEDNYEILQKINEDFKELKVEDSKCEIEKRIDRFADELNITKVIDYRDFIKKFKYGKDIIEEAEKSLMKDKLNFPKLPKDMRSHIFNSLYNKFLDRKNRVEGRMPTVTDLNNVSTYLIYKFLGIIDYTELKFPEPNVKRVTFKARRGGGRLGARKTLKNRKPFF